MSLVYPNGYYNRSSASAAKGFEQHVFLANSILQSAEVNEIQDEGNARIKGIGDVLFRDGAPINYAQVVVNSATGAAAGDAGIIYAAGKLYAVPSASFTLSTSGTVSIGVYLTRTIVGPLDDATLKDPALEAPSYQEPGASRVKAELGWGTAGDGQLGTFYSIYTAVNGVLQPYTPPPDISPIQQAIARYDRQATGSNYVSWGLSVTQLDDVGDDQQFLISEGEARLQGHEIIQRSSQRVFFTEDSDLNTVIAETRTVTGDNPFTVTVNRPPISSVTLITAQKSIDSEGLTKAVGDYDSVAYRDSMVSVTSVYQSTTEYTTPTHYSLTDSGDPPTNQIAWVSSIRPANGSTFYVSYAYTAQYPTDTALLANSSSTHIGVADADEGSTVSVNYLYKMPRYDRLCIDKTGQAVLYQGIAHPDYPHIPGIPRSLLPLAIIHQTWVDATRSIRPDGVRMVPMVELESMGRRINDLTALVADCRNALYGSLYDPAIKRGLLTDSLSDDSLRDLGLDNTAAINFQDQTLQCGIAWTATPILLDESLTLDDASPTGILWNPLKTDVTKVNPYHSISGIIRIPIEVEIRPNIDTWVEKRTANGSAENFTLTEYRAGSIEANLLQRWVQKGITRRQEEWVGGDGTSLGIKFSKIVDSGLRLASTTEIESEFLRTNTIAFTISNFIPFEPLESVTFDGITVIPRETP